MNKKTLKIAGWALGLSMAVAGIGVAAVGATLAANESPLMVKAEEVAYKTALFGSTYNSGNIADYTSTWYSETNGFRVDITNFNNNNCGWDYIKAGRKNSASVGTIATHSAIDKKIDKVVVTIDSLTAAKINSITLYTSSDGSDWASAGTFTKSTGAQAVNIASPAANNFYKLSFDCASGSSNGLIQISKVEFFQLTEPELSISDDSALVSVGGNTSLTLTPTNFTGTPTYTYEDDEDTHASLAFVGNVATVTGLAVTAEPIEFTITASYLTESASVTLSVTVEAARTYDSLDILTQTSDKTFIEGDALTASDIVVAASFTVGPNEETVTFSEALDNLDDLTFEPALGSTLSTIGTNTVTISYTYSGTTHSASYNIEVSEAPKYGRVGKNLNDFAGTFLIVYEVSETSGYVWNFGDTDKNYTAVTIADGEITSNDTIDALALTIEAGTSTGYAITDGENYVYATSSDNKFSFQASAAAKCDYTIEIDNYGNAIIGSTNASKYIHFNSTRFRNYAESTGSNPSLYKYNAAAVTSNKQDVDAFVSNYMKMNQYIDDDSYSESRCTENWGAAKTAFNALSEEQRALFLSDAAFADAAERLESWAVANGSSLNDVTNKYDMNTVISSRTGADNTNLPLAITIIVATGLASVAGFAFIRRKKEDR